MCVSIASRTRSATKINPVASVSGNDVELVLVDLGTKAEASKAEKSYCYR